MLEITMVDFLEAVPPGEPVHVVDLLKDRGGMISLTYLNTPDVQLHCRICGGARNFSCIDRDIAINQTCSVFRTFCCRNCGEDSKQFAISIEYTGPNRPDVAVWKVGEFPLFATTTAITVAGMKPGIDDLHPKIREACIALCHNGHLAEGVEKGFKVVRDRLRTLTGYETGSEAFGKGKLKIRGAAGAHVEADFNEGVKFLTMAIDRFRNEKAHVVDGNIEDELRAYEYLRLSSLAMHLLENACCQDQLESPA